MSSEPPLSTSDTTTGSQATRAVAGQGPLALSPLAGCLYALLAGALIWLLLQAFFPLFTIPQELADLPTPAPVQDLERQEQAEIKANSYDAVVALGFLGSLIGGVLAFGEGIARRSLRTTLLATLLCVVVGLLFGMLAGFLGHTIRESYKSVQDTLPLVKTLCMQGVMLAVLGCGVGLGLGVVSGRVRSAVMCLVGGVSAGVIAALLYPMLAAVIMPNVDTEIVLPNQAGSQFLWLALVTGFMGLTIPGMASKRKTCEASSATDND